MTSWTIHIEPLTSILRVFPAGHGYGDPYAFCITIRYLSPKEIELVGTTSSVTPSMWRDTRAALKEAGIETVRWKRIVDGVEKEHVFDLTE